MKILFALLALFAAVQAEELKEIQYAKVNYFEYNLNNLPVMLYINVDQLDNDEENDVTFNFFIEGPLSTPFASLGYRMSMKGFLLNYNYIKKREEDSSLKPEFHSAVNGHYDSLIDYGISVFRGKDIKDYETQYDKILLILIQDKNKLKTQEEAPAKLKVVAMPSKNIKYNLIKNTYFYSQIQYAFLGKTYNIYSLDVSDGSIILLEYSSCYGGSNFAINLDKNFLEENIYRNDTRIDIEYQSTSHGKRFLILRLPENTQNAYLVVFPDTEDKRFHDSDTIHFVVKYRTFSPEHFDKNAALNSYSLSNYKISYSKNSKEKSVSFSFKRASANKGYSIRYFLRVYSRNKFKFDDEINNICLYNHAVAQYEVSEGGDFKLENFPKGEMFVNIIGVSKSSTSDNEEIFAYDGLRVDERLSSKEGSHMTLLVVGLIVLIFILLLVMLYFYKIIRKLQVQHVYQLIDARKKKGKVFIEKEDDENMKRNKKNISTLIEIDN